MTRRSLISKLALAATPTFAAVPREESHTLIHVFLRGGADTLNLFVPHADDHYYRCGLGWRSRRRTRSEFQIITRCIRR
jgi:uncharacterized protein (DUF1501 family)